MFNTKLLLSRSSVLDTYLYHSHAYALRNYQQRHRRPPSRWSLPECQSCCCPLQAVRPPWLGQDAGQGAACVGVSVAAVTKRALPLLLQAAGIAAWRKWGSRTGAILSTVGCAQRWPDHTHAPVPWWAALWRSASLLSIAFTVHTSRISRASNRKHA